MKVESINAATFSSLSSVLATRKLKSCDLEVTAYSKKIKSVIQDKEGWKQLIAGKTKVKTGD
jgi:hypothetical protein